MIYQEIIALQAELTKKVSKLTEDFTNGKISKFVYLESMGSIYQILPLFINRLENSCLKQIEISQEGIIFIFHNNIKLFDRKMEKLGIQSHALSLGNYEEEEAIIYKLISREDVIFDIGANVGWYALNFAKKFPTTRIFAFEPVPETFMRLAKNAELNKVTINLNNFGFSDYECSLPIYLTQDESALASMEPICGETSSTIEAKFLTLDSFVEKQKINKLDFIKCDVEGAELKVIKGGNKSIRKFLPIIILELYEGWTNKFSYSPSDVINLLQDLGYGCFLLKEGRFSKIKNYEIEAKYCNEENNNFFFLHLNKHKLLIQKFFQN